MKARLFQTTKKFGLAHNCKFFTIPNLGQFIKGRQLDTGHYLPRLSVLSHPITTLTKLFSSVIRPLFARSSLSSKFSLNTPFINFWVGLRADKRLLYDLFNYCLGEPGEGKREGASNSIWELDRMNWFSKSIKCHGFFEHNSFQCWTQLGFESNC